MEKKEEKKIQKNINDIVGHRYPLCIKIKLKFVDGQIFSLFFAFLYGLVNSFYV